jgi:ATP-dependent Lon protease
MKTIQNELGGNPVEKEIEEYRKKAQEKKWREETAKVFEKELDKLHRLNPAAAEYSVQVNYIQTLLDLPWEEYTRLITLILAMPGRYLMKIISVSRR